MLLLLLFFFWGGALGRHVFARVGRGDIPLAAEPIARRKRARRPCCCPAVRQVLEAAETRGGVPQLQVAVRQGFLDNFLFGRCPSPFSATRCIVRGERRWTTGLVWQSIFVALKAARLSAHLIRSVGLAIICGGPCCEDGRTQCRGGAGRLAHRRRRAADGCY